MSKVRERMDALGISQVDMILELQKRGYAVQPPMMSSILRGVYTYPKAQKILSECEAILDEKEKEHQKTVLRHEIIHAFLFESGLSDSWEHKPQGHEETVVDWIAIQFPKILEVFEKAGAL